MFRRAAAMAWQAWSSAWPASARRQHDCAARARPAPHALWRRLRRASRRRRAKCLRAGEFCSPSHESDYERYGFACVAVICKAGAAAGDRPTIDRVAAGDGELGRTVTAGEANADDRLHARRAPGPTVLARRLLQRAHEGGALLVDISHRLDPQRARLREASGRGRVRDGAERLRPHDRDRPHRLARARRLQRHRQPFPEPGSGPASYHVKDKLENKLHELVCAGSMTLHAAQVGIATNWRALYKTVYGDSP